MTPGTGTPGVVAARRRAALVVPVLLAFAAVLPSCGKDSVKVEVVQGRTPVTHEYVIPFGTGRRLAGGEQIEIVPRVLNVKVGDTIRIRNQDAYETEVGIFHVAPGETVTMKFRTPGKLVGACDVHPSGEFIIDVRA